MERESEVAKEGVEVCVMDPWHRMSTDSEIPNHGVGSPIELYIVSR